MTIDLDSTICEVAGHLKQGAAFGYTKVLGYHPILATRADTGEIIHARMRKGSANTQRGARRFIDELIARVRRAGATGRDHDADGLRVLGQGHDHHLEAARCALHDGHPLRVQAPSRRRSSSIDENAWIDIAYPDGGVAQVAETTYTTGRHTLRLVVRRTRLTGRAQQRLWPDWRHHAFLTDLTGDVVNVDRFHRQHATIELAIRDLKDGAGLEHVPSGRFHANSAWLQCAVLAHNLTRWTALLGEVRVDDQLVVTRSIRTRLLALPARLVNRSGRPTLRMPTDWPWADQFVTALNALRDLQPAQRLTPRSRTGAPQHRPRADSPTQHDPCSRAGPPPRNGASTAPNHHPTITTRHPGPNRWIEAKTSHGLLLRYDETHEDTASEPGPEFVFTVVRSPVLGLVRAMIGRVPRRMASSRRHAMSASPW